MGSATLVSVCIPVYNNAHFIARAVKCVLEQTHSRLELLINDNGSDDGTADLIRQFRDPRIDLVENGANLGMCANWNRVVGRAKGDYIKLLCSDDEIAPDCLARQTAALEDPANAGAVLAVCARRVINARGEVVFARRCPFPQGLVQGKRLIRHSARWGTNRIGEPAVGLFRRRVLERTGLFEPSNPYLIDLAFWAALLKEGDAYVDERCMASFRLSSGSVSAQVGLRQAACFRSFLRQLQRDPYYSLPGWQRLAGSMLAFQWCLLRNLALRFGR